MSNIEKVIKNRKVAVATITRIEIYLKNNEKTVLHKYDYEHRLEMIKEAFDKFCVAQDEIEDLNDDEDVIGNRMEIEDKYFSLLTRLKILIDKASQDSSNPLQHISSNSTVNQWANSSNSKLPEISIEKFTGLQQNWVSFYEMFKAIVLNRDDLPEVQKLIYLRSSLKGEPLKLIENLSLESSNLLVAIEILKTRYENKLACIYSHIKSLLELPSINKGNASSLREFSVSIKQNYESLKNLRVPVDQWNLILVYVLSQKLDFNTRRAYELERGPSNEPTLIDFLKFVETRCQVVENLASPDVTKRHLHITRKTGKVCIYCDMTNHSIFKCKTFKEISPYQRRQFISFRKLCFKCFSSHHVSQCTWKNCPSCNQPHNSLLHTGNINRNANKVSGNISENNRSENNNCISEDSKPLGQRNEGEFSGSSREDCTFSKSSLFVNKYSHILLATAVVNIINNGKLISARAVLDSGSQISLVSSRLARKLKYNIYNKNISISGISGNMLCKQSINIEIMSKSDKIKNFQVSCAVTDSITSNLPQFPINFEKLEIPKSIILADNNFHVPQQVDLLLGSDIYFSLLTPGLIRLGDELPVLQNTHLGWVIGGVLPENFLSHFISTHSDFYPMKPLSLFIHSNDIDMLLQKFWTVESVKTDSTLSTEDAMSEQVFKSTTILKNEIFQVNIPLKSSNENLKLGESFSLCKKRFLSLEKKLHKNPQLFNQYSEFIDEYIELGHARYIPLELKNQNNEHKYFIPHHCVVKNDRVTTRLRVVFDASMKSTSGYSLNDICLKGRVVQPELFDILCRFRIFKFVLVADIKKMYRMIRVNRNQTFLQNILWRKHPSHNLRCIELLTVSYGTNFAPYVSTRCLIELADLYENDFTKAANVIKTQTYVDDILCGANSVSELLTIKNELISLLKLGNFSLHKWCSNSTEFMQEFNLDSEITNYSFDVEGCSNKVLGISWNPRQDYFSVSLPKDINIYPITKRNVLSVIAQIYDPLGFVAPLVIIAKIFMQKLWLAKVQWDEPLTTLLKQEWLTFSRNILELSELKISRCLFVGNNEIKTIELHGYSDSSLKAYGCCIYLRVIYQNNQVSCNLISAKSRVSPLRTVSLPRLELCACVLLSQLTHKVIDIYKNVIKIDSVNLWTDSLISLAWIKSHPSKWNIFVSNRVSLIQELTNECRWRHVRSKDNPSDYVSRGLTSYELINSDVWWNGPQYLQNPNLNLDMFNYEPISQILPEEKKVLIVSKSQQFPHEYLANYFDRFSDFIKIQRTVAMCLRFANNCFPRNKKLQGALKVVELQNSLNVIIKILQSKYFSQELHDLKHNKVLRNKHLKGLCPFLDEIGIMRVGGRLSNANIPYSQMHPILLPSKCHVVNLMLKKEHLRLYHGGPQLVLTSFRTRFWPLNALRAIKRIIHNCITCFRFQAKGAEQIMASLPKDRITISRPFLKVGVDFAGYFYLKTSNLKRSPKTKAYIAIFVCMITKCVHIELVSGLSTECFLLTLKRFIARRGNPAIIYSDNAKNFLGSRNKLKELYDFFKSKENSKTIEDFLSKNETKWKFIPPQSPHWGGIWEAAIKSTKYHIMRTIGETLLNFEEFTTVLATIESILNSRPLTVLSNDPNDFNPLTPAHFLIGDILTAYPDKDIQDISDNRLSLYQKCLKIKQQFWKRWSIEYLNRLQNRPKWISPSTSLKVNQVVLVKEDNLPPLKWCLGRIIEIPNSPDKKVRLVKVKTKDGIFIRSITKLCPLPNDEFAQCKSLICI